MAKPAGAITPSDGGVAAQSGTANWRYCYFCFRLPAQPSHWKSTYPGMRRHTVQPSFQYTVAAANTLREKWRFYADPSSLNNNELTADDTTGAANGWKSRNETAALFGIPCNAPPLSDPDTLPRYAYGYVAFQEPGAVGGTTELVGCYIEQLDIDTYSTPDPTGERSLERTDRETIRLYTADQPASAWHAQWLLCHSMNKIEYEARQCWSVPF